MLCLKTCGRPRAEVRFQAQAAEVPLLVGLPRLFSGDEKIGKNMRDEGTFDFYASPCLKKSGKRGKEDDMKQYVSVDKRSKKARKEYYSKMRRDWGGLNPATRTAPNGKAYDRNKDKQERRKTSREPWDEGEGLVFG